MIAKNGTCTKARKHIRHPSSLFQIVAGAFYLLFACCSQSHHSPNTVDKLPMFGKWKIVKFEFGNGISAMDDQEAKTWLGKIAEYDSALAKFDADQCQRPSYKASIKNAEEYFYDEFATAAKTLGLAQERVEIIEIFCGENAWDSPSRLLIKLNDDKAFMVSDGVFFLLEKQSP
jgi:hypothetical protein